MTSQAFREYLQERSKLDPHFNSSDLVGKFVEHFRSGCRIQVKDKSGMTFAGYVGITTGWKPSFILLYNRKSTSSGVLLSKSEEIVQVYPRRKA